jgi:hypothetical protein
MLSKRTRIGVKLSRHMNATIGIIELLGHPLLWVGAILLLAGLTLGLAAIMWALHNAPEGYEDAKGFHSKHRSPSVKRAPDVSLLHPHNAG